VVEGLCCRPAWSTREIHAAYSSAHYRIGEFPNYKSKKKLGGLRRSLIITHTAAVNLCAIERGHPNGKDALE
jgi:hypothetical protein